MAPVTVLILGGTAEARALARVLVDQQVPLVSSLAGRVSDPALPAGPVRVGGFGGPDGLAAFLVRKQISAVVDATHPFAAQISRNAVDATGRCGCPLVRLARPGWREHPDAEAWTWVVDAAQARAAGGAANRPFLTTGRQSLEAFLSWADRSVLVRVVEPPARALPPLWRLVRSRGPYSYGSDRQLMLDHDVDLLVTKDSGGAHTEAKLRVARDLGVPVVVIARPAAIAGTTTVGTVEEVLDWLQDR